MSKSEISKPFQREDARTYLWIGRLLLTGLLASILVMAIGLIVSAVRSSTAVHVLALDEVVPHLLRGDASAILDAGILLLFATPLLGVFAALFSFVANKDRLFSGVTCALLAMLALAVVIALK